MNNLLQRLEGPMLTRGAAINPESILSEEDRRVRLSFSSEEPYLRSSYFDDPWVEILGHGSSEVDMGRLSAGGAPLLYNHSSSGRDNHIGVVEKAWIENGRGYAEVRFSKRADIDGVWSDVKDGILTGVSVGYKINERKLIKEHKDKPGEYRVVRWEPMEISMVPLAADPTVGVGRSEKFVIRNVGDDVSTNKEDTTLPTVEADTTTIRKLIRTAQLPESLADELVNTGATVEAVRAVVLEKLIERGGKETVSHHHCGVTSMTDNVKDFLNDASDALLARAGIGMNISDSARNLAKYKPVDLAEQLLRMQGVSTIGMDSRAILNKSFASRSHSTSDFTFLLSNTAGKSLRMAYLEEPATFGSWTGETEVRDFKQQTLISLSEAPDLELVREGGEYTHGSFSDAAEVFQIAKYGKMFKITYEALVNDDLNGFTRLPQAFGKSARRKEADLVYGVLTSNPTLNDGVALFHADHANLGTVASTSVDLAALQAGRLLMRKQKGLNSLQPLNIAPRFLIVPAALESEAEQLLASLVDPTKSNATPNNEFVRSLELVVDSRLDADSTSKFYLAANPGQVDTITRAYLAGSARPYYEVKDGWETDDMQVKCRLEVAAVPVDYRGLVQITLS